MFEIYVNHRWAHWPSATTAQRLWRLNQQFAAYAEADSERGRLVNSGASVDEVAIACRLTP